MWPPSENEWIVIGQAITAVAALFAWRQSRQNAKRQVENNAASRAAIHEIHLTINSRLTQFQAQSAELLATSVKAAHAKGLAEGEARRSDIVE